MATETVLATYNDVKFIQGTTPMNQTNWQSYFSPAIPNGIYNGFQCTGDGTHKGIARVYDGTAFVNGICATVSTTNGYTTIPYNIATDRFICLRVYFNEQTAELVERTGSSSISESWIWRNYFDYVQDESAGCIRNDEYYELPIWYMGPSYSSTATTNYDLGFDLRRTIELQKNLTTNPDTYDIENKTYFQICKDHKYVIHCASPESIAAIDLINPPDEVIITAEGWVNHNFSISFVPWFENWGNIDQLTYFPTTGIKFYGLSDRWTVISDSNPIRIKTVITDVTHLTYFGVRLTLASKSGASYLTYKVEDLFREEA